jgi:hypothetical protein
MLVDEGVFSAKLARSGIARFLVVSLQKKHLKFCPKWVNFGQKQPKTWKNQAKFKPFFVLNRASGYKKNDRKSGQKCRILG